MSQNLFLDGRDLPIVKLVPRSERKVEKRDYQRIEASLRTRRRTRSPRSA